MEPGTPPLRILKNYIFLWLTIIHRQNIMSAKDCFCVIYGESILFPANLLQLLILFAGYILNKIRFV
jgi:hypothetical protein